MTRQPYLDAVAERVVVFDGAFGTYIQGLGLSADDFGGADLEGCNEYALPHPARRDPRHARGVLRRRRRRRRDGELRQLLDGAHRVRRRRQGVRAQRRRRPSGPRGRRRLRHRRAHALRRRVDRAGHEAAEPRAHRLRRPARLLRGAGRRPARGRRRPVRHRDVLGPAAGQGGDDRLPSGDEVGGSDGARAGTGDDGDDRADARRQRDRRRPRVARGDAAGRAGHQLRHRARRRCRSTCASCHGTRRCRSACCPTPACPASSTGARTTTSRRRRSPSSTCTTSPTSACRSSAAAAGRRPSTSARSSRRSAASNRPLGRPRSSRASRPIYSPVTLAQDLSVLMIGERTNANGSRAFRDAMLAGDWDNCVKMANEQIKEGAHVLDVCVDYVGRDGTVDMDEIAKRFATQASVPLVIDSTEPQVLEAALTHIGGRAILNSANLEDGELPGQPAGPRVLARPRLRRCRDLPAHRRARPGPRRRMEDGGRPPHHRDRHRALRAAAERPDLRRPDVPALDGRRRPAPRRHRHDRCDPPDQGRDPGRLHRARPVQRQLRAVAGRAPRPQQRVPPRVHGGRARRGDRPRRQDRPAQPPAGRAARGLPRPGVGPAQAATTTRSPQAARRVRRRQVAEGREARPQRHARSTSGSRRASSTATATGSPSTSTRRWPAGCRRSTSSTPCCSTG